MKFISSILFLTLLYSFNVPAQEKVNPRKEYIETLTLLTNALLTLQVTDQTSPDYGALRCNFHKVFHTRAAEAVFPFMVMYDETGNSKYLNAAKSLGNWVIKQQNEKGAWVEGATRWTGTSNDILLMLSLAYPLIKKDLSNKEKESWKLSIKKASDYLVDFMNPYVASINYLPTTAAALMTANKIVPDIKYVKQAKLLADWTINRMDEAGFIQGEGGRVFKIKYGVDLLYAMDMSLYGLELYAKLNNDKKVEDAVKKSLKKNLNFIYPNGALDGSWGVRCYKWTTYGSKTADGSQVIFTLLANVDKRYVTASLKNARYIRTMMKNGFLGYGPHFWDYMPDKLCIYPTFARAKNFAMAAFFSEDKEVELPEIPSDITGWYKYYPTINTVLARSKNFMITISAYNYHNLTHFKNDENNQAPKGGAACNIWLKDFGFLQTSSQTKYVRGEPEHMPVMPDTVISLTPRIEFTNENGYFTNLYEGDARIKINKTNGAVVEVTTVGELKNKDFLEGGVGYKLTHIVGDNFIEKDVEINFHDEKPVVKIIEPIVNAPQTKIKIISPKKALIEGEKVNIQFEIVEGDFKLSVGDKPDNYFFPFPSMKCYPLQIIVNPPTDGFIQSVKYRLSLEK